MDELLSPALLVRVALGVIRGGEAEREAWDRLAELVAKPAADRPEAPPAAQQELRAFEAVPTSAARAEELIHALGQRARKESAFDEALNAWVSDARHRSYTHNHGSDERGASLHGSVVQAGAGNLVTFVTYGPQRHPLDS
ncbi:hypothetical protein ACFY8W_36505 [Streptomyces sp. NPDC012637]|uniref:hypothetical protein n=1 Tax=Streptomyces sp. NPDC012637 TaxID=3364842 RepID=UPI0036F06778